MSIFVDKFLYMKGYLQYWEESERGRGVVPAGCTLHVSLKDHLEYINMIYMERTFNYHVPDEYDKKVGPPVEVEIEEGLYKKLFDKKYTIKLSEVEINNLIKIGDIQLLNPITSISPQ